MCEKRKTNARFICLPFVPQGAVPLQQRQALPVRLAVLRQSLLAEHGAQSLAKEEPEQAIDHWNNAVVNCGKRMNRAAVRSSLEGLRLQVRRFVHVHVTEGAGGGGRGSEGGKDRLQNAIAITISWCWPLATCPWGCVQNQWKTVVMTGRIWLIIWSRNFRCWETEEGRLGGTGEQVCFIAGEAFTSER